MEIEAKRSGYKGDDILQLLDTSDLSAVDAILTAHRSILDYEGEDENTLEKVDEIPSIADIVNSLGKEKVLKMDDEDRSLLFPDPVGFAKWCEENPDEIAYAKTEAQMSSEIRKNFKELAIVGNGI